MLNSRHPNAQTRTKNKQTNSSTTANLWRDALRRLGYPFLKWMVLHAKIHCKTIHFKNGLQPKNNHIARGAFVTTSKDSLKWVNRQ